MDLNELYFSIIVSLRLIKNCFMYFSVSKKNGLKRSYGDDVLSLLCF